MGVGLSSCLGARRDESEEATKGRMRGVESGVSVRERRQSVQCSRRSRRQRRFFGVGSTLAVEDERQLGGDVRWGKVVRFKSLYKEAVEARGWLGGGWHNEGLVR